MNTSNIQSIAPTSVLFACTHNSIRSPMAEGIMRSLYGSKIFVTSAGVRALDVDGFAIEVMDEIGLNMENHLARNFNELEDTSFDLIVCLSREAKSHAEEITRTMASDVEYWITLDPSQVEGNREMRLNAYRQVRDDLYQKIRGRFSTSPHPLV
ncbi:MAG: arsenate reductase ArsC [Sneathiella sp.]|nr:arsenate reductase ArsC [Sneathiella sp.]